MRVRLEYVNLADHKNFLSQLYVLLLTQEPGWGESSPGDDAQIKGVTGPETQSKDATNKWPKIGQIYDHRQGRIVNVVIVVCARCQASFPRFENSRNVEMSLTRFRMSEIQRDNLNNPTWAPTDRGS